MNNTINQKATQQPGCALLLYSFIFSESEQGKCKSYKKKDMPKYSIASNCSVIYHGNTEEIIQGQDGYLTRMKQSVQC